MAKRAAIEMLTYEEAADRLRMSKRAFHRLLARGLFGRVIQGRQGCVFSDEIDAYIEGLAKGSGELALRNYRIKAKRI